jgi:hypothetical protein
MNLKLHPEHGFARVIYLGEHAMDWALDKIGSPAHESSGEEDLLAAAGIGTIVRRGKVRSYALRLNELIIHNNRTWFGDGDIRLDALVVQGSGSKSKSDFYHPSTFSFPRVADGEALSIGQPGLLLYYGQPRYFLDLFLLASRDSGNSEKLADLLKQNVTAKELDPAVTPLLLLATSAITANAISLALQAAVTVGNVAYRAVQAVTSNTIGVYRVSFLQVTDNFGAGKHPEVGYLDIKDLSFKYEILAE